MYKLIVLSAVIAVAAGVPVGPGVGLIGLSPLAVAPATILNSPAGAVRNTIANQVLSGVTANQAALNAVALSNPLAANALLNNQILNNQLLNNQILINSGAGLGLGGVRVAGLGGLGLGGVRVGGLGGLGLGGRVIVG